MNESGSLLELDPDQHQVRVEIKFRPKVRLAKSMGTMWCQNRGGGADEMVIASLPGTPWMTTSRPRRWPRGGPSSPDTTERGRAELQDVRGPPCRCPTVLAPALLISTWPSFQIYQSCKIFGQNRIQGFAFSSFLRTCVPQVLIQHLFGGNYTSSVKP